MFFLPTFFRQSLNDQFAHVVDGGEGEDRLVAVEDVKGLRQRPHPIGTVKQHHGRKSLFRSRLWSRQTADEHSDQDNSKESQFQTIRHADSPSQFNRRGWSNLAAVVCPSLTVGWLGGDAQSSNKPRRPAHHRHELLVVEKEIEPNRQRDYAEKQLSHIGISPLQ
jgi:hypothetical protein